MKDKEEQNCNRKSKKS